MGGSPDWPRAHAPGIQPCKDTRIQARARLHMRPDALLTAVSARRSRGGNGIDHYVLGRVASAGVRWVLLIRCADTLLRAKVRGPRADHRPTPPPRREEAPDASTSSASDACGPFSITCRRMPCWSEGRASAVGMAPLPLGVARSKGWHGGGDGGAPTTIPQPTINAGGALNATGLE